MWIVYHITTCEKHYFNIKSTTSSPLIPMKSPLDPEHVVGRTKVCFKRLNYKPMIHGPTCRIRLC